MTWIAASLEPLPPKAKGPEAKASGPLCLSGGAKLSRTKSEALSGHFGPTLPGSRPGSEDAPADGAGRLVRNAPARCKA